MPRLPLAVGDIVHGFAYGAFGRDHYDCVRIEAVGPDWIVARDANPDDTSPSFTTGRESLELCQQARDEGHRGTVDEPTQPCPLGAVEPPLTDLMTNPEPARRRH
ncbi:hypothetical protein ACFWN1_14650 [Streptomyces sp. NPDC058459]|uniref:hypothetical protein n=1 Tax=Streptomyces sp. NPDC058459 TaxID=3346508 RepID=UPI00365BAB6E